MRLSISKTQKGEKNKGGRPAVHATPVLVRLRPEQVKTLDEWRKRDGVGRPEAIRRLIDLTLMFDPDKKPK